MQRIFVFIPFVIICAQAISIKAQIINIDSLLSLKDDSAKVNLLIKAGRTELFRFSDALKYSKPAIEISKKINYQLGLAHAYRLTGSYYSDILMQIDTALSYYQKADSIYHLKNTSEFIEGVGAIQFCYGNIKLNEGKNVDAAQLFLNAAKLLESIHNKTYLPRIYNTLANLYLNFGIYSKAESYARSALKMTEETNNLLTKQYVDITLAAILIEQKKFKEALPYILEAKRIGTSGNNYNILYLSYYNLGMYYAYYLNDFGKAIKYTSQALECEKLIDNKWILTKIKNNLAYFYFRNQQYKEAKVLAQETYQLADSLKSNFFTFNALCNWALPEAEEGQYKNAYYHLLRAYNLRDTVYISENRKQINDLEELYQAEKKENKITELQKEKKISELSIKRKNVAIYAMFVSLVLIAGIGFFIYRNIQQKRILIKKESELQKHQIRELENERMLLATQSVLKGEESERRRLARDLHDGLGGLLSGVKTSLNNMKGNVILSSESVNDFNLAVNMLDSSISELRRVAHNMMPEALMRLGLKDTLTDYCNELDKVQSMQIIFQFYGQFERLDPNLEINIYRIIQELLNNALKHSDAKEVLIQMIQESKRLCFIVIDDGKGFDTKQISQTKGVGLASIKSRVDTFNGQMEINSKPNKGTEISIEFFI